MRRSAEAVEGDVGFQLAMMGSDKLESKGIEEQKTVWLGRHPDHPARSQCRCRQTTSPSRISE